MSDTEVRQTQLGDYEENLVFREQELGPALKRRAIAVYNASVPKYHPDNGSDVRKMLESQRKSFRELLEKESINAGNLSLHYVHSPNLLWATNPGIKTRRTRRPPLLAVRHKRVQKLIGCEISK